MSLGFIVLKSIKSYFPYRCAAPYWQLSWRASASLSVLALRPDTSDILAAGMLNAELSQINNTKGFKYELLQDYLEKSLVYVLPAKGVSKPTAFMLRRPTTPRCGVNG